MCGKTAACTLLTDRCDQKSGTCLCGTFEGCNKTISDNCVNGICKCKAEPACIGFADNCDKGSCKCKNNPPCLLRHVDTCDNGLCKCGKNQACN